MTDEPPKIMRLSDYAGGRASGEEPPSVPLLSLEQLRGQARNTQWLVKHAMPADALGLLYGASQTFKSFIALDLAMHVAHGLAWLGKKTRQGPVIIVAGEGATGAWKRIVAWHRLHRLPWSNAPVYVVPIPVDLGSDAALVREAAKAADVVPALVVVDTLSQTFRGEENSAGEVAAYLQELGLQLRSCWQCTVLVVHHTGYTVAERPRGSSAFGSNVDFMFGVSRDEREMLATMENTKQKEDALLAPQTFALSVIELGRDEDDEPITSLVARGLDGKGDVLDVMAHEAQRGRGGRNHLFLELAANGTEEKKLRQMFCEAVDGDATAKRVAYFRAKKWAIAAGLVEFAEGIVIRLERT